MQCSSVICGHQDKSPGCRLALKQGTYLFGLKTFTAAAKRGAQSDIVRMACLALLSL